MAGSLSRNLSQERFGELIGQSRAWVGIAENGKRNLTMRTVEMVAIRLGVRPSSMYLPRDDPEPETS